ncbi:MAG: primase-helicase family protein, partial [Myxococcota bacterium]
VHEVVAAGNGEHAAYILSWLADVVQRPASKPGVAIVLKGLKGVGKDTLAEIMSAIIGRRHVAHYSNSDRITDKFNAQLGESLLIHAEEAAWGGHQKNKGTLQSLITAPTVDLERKGLDVVKINSFHRLLFTTNEEWSVPATADERRYAVFNVADLRRGDREFWNALYSQIQGSGPAGFLAYLQSWKTPPGVELRNPPQTVGLAGEKLAGLRNVDRWWHGLLTDGGLPGAGNWPYDDDEQSDWEYGWQTVDKAALRAAYETWWSAERHAGDRLSPADFGKALFRLCPSAKEKKPRDPEGRRTRCYHLPSLADCRDAFARVLGIEPEACPWR